MDKITKIRNSELWSSLFGYKVGDRVKWCNPYTIPQKEEDWFHGIITSMTKDTITIVRKGTNHPLYLPTEERRKRYRDNRPYSILIIE